MRTIQDMPKNQLAALIQMTRSAVEFWEASSAPGAKDVAASKRETLEAALAERARRDLNRIKRGRA